MGNFWGGITNTGSTDGSRYAVRTDMGDKPVNYVTWFDAARVSNWLQAGGGTYLTSTSGSAAINSGAYTLNGATSGNAPGVNNGATFYVPTQDQWYKAAFYKGGGTNAGYWYYATQSDATPTAVTAGTTGSGSAGNTGNFANYSNGADWNSLDGNVTTVGTNGGPSAYGAFDMSGNLYEWNDLDGTTGSNRGIRGGGWSDPGPARLSSQYSYSWTPANEDNNYGFRLARSGASTSAVPEIDPNSLGSVLALVVGSLGLLERRRLKVRLAA